MPQNGFYQFCFCCSWSVIECKNISSYGLLHKQRHFPAEWKNQPQNWSHKECEQNTANAIKTIFVIQPLQQRASSFSRTFHFPVDKLHISLPTLSLSLFILFRPFRTLPNKLVIRPFKDNYTHTVPMGHAPRDKRKHLFLLGTHLGCSVAVKPCR